MVELLTYDISSDVAAFSTHRHSGVSRGAYSSFNISTHCGDNDEDAQHNLHLLCRQLGVKEERLIVSPSQIHGTATFCIDTPFLALPKAEQQAKLSVGYDALITDVKELFIGISTADCVPILLYDPQKKAIGAVHAGWRGTCARIVNQTLTAMKEIYGTQVENVRAVIGPSISVEAFEVGDEVYAAFEKENFPMASIAKTYGDKWHIDLWAANTFLLLEAGLDLVNIHCAGVCTYTHHDKFFSARRLGIRSGRILHAIALKG